jgi:hypothetical protein
MRFRPSFVIEKVNEKEMENDADYITKALSSHVYGVYFLRCFVYFDKIFYVYHTVVEKVTTP